VDSREVPNATETVATDTARVADLNAAADASAAFFRGDEIAVATDEETPEDDEDEEDAGSSEKKKKKKISSPPLSPRRAITRCRT
jgi:hypothetical protein